MLFVICNHKCVLINRSINPLRAIEHAFTIPLSIPFSLLCSFPPSFSHLLIGSGSLWFFVPLLALSHPELCPFIAYNSILSPPYFTIPARIISLHFPASLPLHFFFDESSKYNAGKKFLKTDARAKLCMDG
jgi:hypothetical protein